MRQLPLDLGHRPALNREDFLVAPCNRDAVAWVDKWPNWPGPGKLGGLILWGPTGSGKTHLAHVWRQNSKALALTVGDLSETNVADLLGDAAHVLVEDFLSESGKTKSAEICLFNIHNHLSRVGGSLLVTGTMPPARSALTLADLRSRLNAFSAAPIREPDDRLIEAVLLKLFRDRQLNVGEDVIAYLLARMERSFAAAAALVEALDKAALANHRQVTKPLARSIMEP